MAPRLSIVTDDNFLFLTPLSEQDPNDTDVPPLEIILHGYILLELNSPRNVLQIQANFIALETIAMGPARISEFGTPVNITVSCLEGEKMFPAGSHR